MSFELPSLDEIIQRIQNDVQNELPESNPFLPQSWIRGVITSYAGRFEEFYNQFQLLFNALFVNTTSGEFVDLWGAVFDFSRLPASSGTGSVNFEGTDGSTIPASTELQSTGGITYTTDELATIATTTFTPVSGNVSGITVTLDTGLTDHGLATGNTITVSGASDAAINGSHVITVIDQDSISYDAEGTVTVGPIAGLTIDFLGASTTVTATTTGSDTNLEAGPQLTFTSAVSGVDTQAYVQFGGITGGSDVESDDDFRDRILTRLANPIAEFSSSAILEKVKILKLDDQTVVVSPIEDPPTPPSPGPGQVIIIVVIVDPDTDEIRQPTTTELDSIKESIETITPANIISPVTADDNVFVTGPDAFLEVDVDITGLLPSTTSMQEAITSNLQAFFVDSITVSQNGVDFDFTRFVKFNQINSVIQESVDPESANRPTDFSFTINGGTVDVAVPVHERAVLGTVSFS
jgi:uncharacterized phage protein gp47/JayE